MNYIKEYSICPSNWDEAEKWENELNEEKESFGEPKWSWDCNFKLDFDGPIVRVSSRFYPPSKRYGEGWDGDVGIYLENHLLKEKAFKCATLLQLRREVEEYVLQCKNKISESIKKIEFP